MRAGWPVTHRRGGPSPRRPLRAPRRPTTRAQKPHRTHTHTYIRPGRIDQTTSTAPKTILTAEWQRRITQFVVRETNCSLDSVLMRSGVP
jgi:hypothetical protein